jgi:hypothetical protein
MAEGSLMKSQRSLAVFAVCAALAAAGCASGARPGPVGPGTRTAGSTSTTAVAAAEGDVGGKPAPKPGDAGAAGAKPAAGASEGKAAAPAPGGGSGPPPTTATRSTRPAAPSGYDEWMTRMGNRLAETKFLGLRLRPRLSEEIDFTDNAFYQDDNEQVVVDLDPPFDPTAGPANPNLGEPRGEVSEIVNNATLGLDFDMPLNVALVPVVGGGQDRVKVLSAEVNALNYLKEDDSPDALNYRATLDLPALLNDLLSRVKSVDASRNAFYVRIEGDYSVITDPLDVAKYEVFSVGQTYRNQGDRNTFTRREWYGKGTLGWRGPVLDAEASFKHYDLFLYDNSLKPANHEQDTYYGEIGWTLRGTPHRFYGLYELVTHDFDSRGDPTTDNDVTTALRDFNRQRTGLGWEGPFLSKKIDANLELYYLSAEVLDRGPLSVQPFKIDPETGQTLTGPGGNPLRERLNGRRSVGGSATVTYRPFLTKATQIEGKYSRDLAWSVVGQDKIIDAGSLTASHPINEKLTGEVFTGATMENVQHREKRLYLEGGLGARYKIAAYTEVFLRYTFRNMSSDNEPATAYADAANQIFLVRADGDFTANIVSLGVSIRF